MGLKKSQWQPGHKKGRFWVLAAIRTSLTPCRVPGIPPQSLLMFYGAGPCRRRCGSNFNKVIPKQPKKGGEKDRLAGFLYWLF